MLGNAEAAKCVRSDSHRAPNENRKDFSCRSLELEFGSINFHWSNSINSMLATNYTCSEKELGHSSVVGVNLDYLCRL